MRTGLPRGARFAVAVLVLAVAGCAGDADGGGEVSPALEVTLEDFSVELERSTVDAGATTFDVVNAGPSFHEFVLLRTDLPAAHLPTDVTGTVEEDSAELEVVAEAESVDIDGTVSVEAPLERGDYVVICNLPSHYGLGMRAPLAVE